MRENNAGLTEQLTRLVWLFHRYYHQNHRQHGLMGDTQRGQGRILTILKLRPEISQKELSYLLDMRPQSLGEFLSKLERKGYITRTQSEQDHRVMNVKLTKEGSEVEEQDFDLDKMFDCLNEEEQKNLSEYFFRLIEKLQTECGEESFGHGSDPYDHRENFHADHFHGRSDWRRR